jgi:hypothetical protein
MSPTMASAMKVITIDHTWSLDLATLCTAALARGRAVGSGITQAWAICCGVSQLDPFYSTTKFQ